MDIKKLLLAAGAVSVAALSALAFRKKGGTEPGKVSDAPGLPASEAHIGKLDPSIQGMVRELLASAWTEAGIPLIVTNGLRDNDEQARLYAQGRTAPGPIVTKAPPGSSWHNFGLAFDVAVLKGGKPTWPNDLKLWGEIGRLGKAVGLAWGGDFTTITDRPHFEYHPELHLADARAGKRPTVA